jgi:RNA polymerase sigma-70 factor (ECF subfamily)
LALSTLVGLSPREIAVAFVISPGAMEQRLTRARRRLRARGDPEGETPERSRDRLPAGLQTVALLFNEGYWSNVEDVPIRADLCRLALGLARSLAGAFPDEPEALGLLALLGLHDARRAARSGPRGEPVPLPDQDRSRWDHAAIAESVAILDRALELGRPGPYQVEAAISALHCRARSAELTEWEEIAALYAALEALRPTAAVRVNRAVALARAHGPAAGLELLGRSGVDVESYPYVHLVRGVLLAEARRPREAEVELRAAREKARNAAERAQVEAHLRRLEGTTA